MKIKKINQIQIFMLTVLSLIGGTVSAEYINCSNVKSQAESIICNNEDLKNVHEELWQAQRAFSVLHGDSEKIRTEWERWVDSLNKCSSSSCIRSHFEDWSTRINQNIFLVFETEKNEDSRGRNIDDSGSITGIDSAQQDGNIEYKIIPTKSADDLNRKNKTEPPSLTQKIFINYDAVESFVDKNIPSSLRSSDLKEISIALYIAYYILLIATPFFPTLILKNEIKNNRVAFANESEITGFLVFLSLIGGFSAALFYLNSVSLRGLAWIGIILCCVGLLGLFGYQRLICKNWFSATFIFIVKILFLSVGFFVSLFLVILALFLTKKTYDKVKKQDYGDAAMQAAMAYGANNASTKITDGVWSYCNGESIEEYSEIAADKGVGITIKDGLLRFIQ